MSAFSEVHASENKAPALMVYKDAAKSEQQKLQSLYAWR